MKTIIDILISVKETKIFSAKIPKRKGNWMEPVVVQKGLYCYMFFRTVDAIKRKRITN